MIDIARFGATVDYAGLPVQYRAPMRAYLERGDLPEPGHPLRLVLEGQVGPALRVAPPFLVGMLVEWIDQHLPACAHGYRDQVQIWIAYLRRARGRAMLAAMEGSPDADAPSKAAP